MLFRSAWTFPFLKSIIIFGKNIISPTTTATIANINTAEADVSLATLAVHGLLHLLGYDHMNEEDKKVMRTLEEEILNEYDITRWKKESKGIKEVY